MIIKFLLLLFIFLTPLISPTSYFGYEQIKVLFFIICISLTGILWMGKGLRWTGISKAAGLFILILLVNSLAGLDPKSSLLGKEPYFQGWVVYAYLFLFSLMVGWSRIKLEYWAAALGGSATLVGLLAIKDWALINIFNHQIPTYAGRVVSTFGQPNSYAGFILLTLPFAGKLGRWGDLVLAVGTLAILVSGSRAAILLLPLIFLIWIKERIKQHKLIFGGIIALFLAIFLISLYLSFKSSSGILWQEVFNPYQSTLKAQANPADSIEKRFFIWPLIWGLAGQNPFTGFGLENIDLSLSNYFIENKHALFEENLNPSSVLIRLKDATIDRTHNYTLDLLMFSGIFGLLAWGFLVCLLIKRARSRTVLVSLLLYLVWVQFQNQSIVHLIYFWFLIGIIDQNILT